jgi:hypothetical protein
MQNQLGANNQNYIIGKVIGEQIRSLEQCGNQPVEWIYVESIKNIDKKFQFGDYVLWFPKGD